MNNHPLKNSIFLLLLCAAALIFLSCGRTNQKRLTIFSAAGMTPVLEKIKNIVEKEINIKLDIEFSGSHLACRKIYELNRKCDIIISADNNLFREILKEHISFRLDFASDEIVIAFGKLAKFADEAEKDPLSVIIQKDVKIARVDETLAPIGYMALFSCILAEKLYPEKYPNLSEIFRQKTTYLADDVMQMVPHLKSGQVDYALIFKSTCIANEIRFAPLPSEINLSCINTDYSKAELIDVPKKGMRLKASPIIFSLSFPDSSENFASAANFAKILASSQIFDEKGFNHISPAKFYGKREIYEKFFTDFAIFCGEEF